MKLLVHLALVLVCAALVACGTPGAPRPPSLELPRPVDDLAAARKGNKVTLTWTPPSQNTDGTLVRRPGVTRVCRGVNDFPMSNCVVVADVPTPPALRGQPRERASYTDTLPQQVEEQFPTGLATYAVQVFNKRGRAAGLSNQVRAPLAPAPAPPAELHAQVTAEGVELAGSGLERPPAVAGVAFDYHLHRHSEQTPADVDLGSMTIEERPGGETLTYVDRSVEWEKTYIYHVAALVTVAQQGKPVAQFQGDDSPTVNVFVHDIFPPAQPVGLQAVFSGVGQKPFIDLTWASNQEPDLAGYNVYRREEGGEWVRLNRDLETAPAFRDPDVVSGHTYFYSVSAVDLRGNESKRSEETSESVPKP